MISQPMKRLRRLIDIYSIIAACLLGFEILLFYTKQHEQNFLLDKTTINTYYIENRPQVLH